MPQGQRNISSLGFYLTPSTTSSPRELDGAIEGPCARCGLPGCQSSTTSDSCSCYNTITTFPVHNQALGNLMLHELRPPLRLHDKEQRNNLDDDVLG